MNIQISIIIPIYNVEKYIRKCVDSILNQSFKSFELILIDDGSDDKSGEICDEYSKCDSRVRVIHKENTGSANSRNIGIKEAKGKYICFVDSDDWIEKDMLKDTNSLAEEYESDIVISGIYLDRVSQEGRIIDYQINNSEFSIWDTEEKLRKNIIKLFPNALINSSCNKLYKRKTILDNNVSFIDTNVGEDTSFNLDIIKYSRSIIVTDKAYYHYMRYEGIKTLTGRLHKDAFKRYLEIHNQMNDLFNEWGVINSNIENEINKTMFSQYFATILKIINCDSKVYSYKTKRQLLNEALNRERIINTFNYSQPTSCNEAIFRMLIKKRLYLLTMLALKIKGN